MNVRLSFGHTSEELFLVTAGLAPRKGSVSGVFSVTTYAHEDVFLGLLMSADLEERELFDTVQAVLLTINAPVFPQRWVDLKLNPKQIAALQLNLNGIAESGRQAVPDELAMLRDGMKNFTRLHDFFLRAPTPLAILMGPEHQFTFINPPYVSLIRRSSAESVLGKTVREALPELKGQPFFRLLDSVYQTGTPYVGREVPGTIRREETGRYEDLIFDFFYQPIRDASGVVEGIMVQATDVTEDVLARQVSADREAQMFRQWTELESIYRTAPVSLSLIDAKDFRFLRANERAAEMHGYRVEEMLGKRAPDLLRHVDGARGILERVAAGETLANVELTGELIMLPGVQRSWDVSLTPVFGANGDVSAITAAVIETTSLKRAEASLLEAGKMAAARSLADSFGNQIAGPLEDLQNLLNIVRKEIRRVEALAALEVAEDELRRIAAIAVEMAERYGLEPDIATVLPYEERMEVAVGQ